MVLDHTVPRMHQWRVNAEVLVLPIQWIVDTPIKCVHWVAERVTSQQKLIDDNEKLRAREFLLQSKLQQLLERERDDSQLKALLKQSAHHLSGHVDIAQLLAVSMRSELNQAIINKGKHEGIYAGQPVLDAYGVIGQVVEVGILTSKILLLHDRHFALPVKDVRNGYRGIVEGSGKEGELFLNYMTATDDIKVGDVFVTSGLGLHFPAGYPVGRVVSVDASSGGRFVRVVLEPSGHFDLTSQVLLSWPDNKYVTKAVQHQLSRSLPNSTI